MINLDGLNEKDAGALVELSELFAKADAVFTGMSNEGKDKCLNSHNESYSINHAVRWGLVAAEELVAGLDRTPKLSPHCNAFFEVIDTCEIGYGPKTAKLSADDSFCDQLTKLQKVCVDNNLGEVHSYTSILEWDQDEDNDLQLTEDRLVVTQSNFWFSAIPNRTSYTIETCMQDIDAFIGAVKNNVGEDLFFGNDIASLKKAVALNGADLNNDRSHAEAEKIAESKASWLLVDNSLANKFVGKIMGVTDHHVVQSLGQSAVIHHKHNLDRVPVKGDVLTISYDGTGKGLVSGKAVDKGVGR